MLIPRPETEHVIETALTTGARRMVDIGTGSGAIAVTLSLETGGHVIATDVSTGALNVAKGNAARLGASVDFVACDLASALRGPFDLMVSNPPYVPSSESLPREVRDFEPGIALYGGEDGLAVYRRLIPEAARLLRPGGWLILELAYNAADRVRGMLEGWEQVRVIPDLAGLPRVIEASVPTGKFVTKLKPL